MICLKGPLRFFIDRQTEYRKNSQKVKVSLGKREFFACRWLLFYFARWSGITPIYRTIWLAIDLHIYTDTGTTPVGLGRDVG